MAGLPDINEGWRSRDRGRSERREKGEALVGKTWLDSQGVGGLSCSCMVSLLAQMPEAVGSESGP